MAKRSFTYRILSKALYRLDRGWPDWRLKEFICDELQQELWPSEAEEVAEDIMRGIEALRAVYDCLEGRRKQMV